MSEVCSENSEGSDVLVKNDTTYQLEDMIFARGMEFSVVLS